MLLLSGLDVAYGYIAARSSGTGTAATPPFLPPMGALAALQYGLTAAPASQPRSALLGQATSGLIAVAMSYLPPDIVPTWTVRALAPAFGLAATVRLGIVHPPAGAAAVLLVSRRGNWALYGMLLLGTALSFLPAVVVNNLSYERQYPLYWGLLPRRRTQT